MTLFANLILATGIFFAPVANTEAPEVASEPTTIVETTAVETTAVEETVVENVAIVEVNDNNEVVGYMPAPLEISTEVVSPAEETTVIINDGEVVENPTTEESVVEETTKAVEETVIEEKKDEVVASSEPTTSEEGVIGEKVVGGLIIPKQPTPPAPTTPEVPATPDVPTPPQPEIPVVEEPVVPAEVVPNPPVKAGRLPFAIPLTGTKGEMAMWVIIMIASVMAIIVLNIFARNSENEKNNTRTNLFVAKLIMSNFVANTQREISRIIGVMNLWFYEISKSFRFYHCKMVM